MVNGVIISSIKIKQIQSSAIILLIFVVVVGTNQQSSASSGVLALLQQYTPGVSHEAVPHGVPESFDWKYVAELKRLEPPNAEMTYINMRGAVYVGQENTRPANTRVEIANCEAYGLSKSSNTWQRIIDLRPNKITGRGWKEDFSTNDGASKPYTNIRDESNGYKSVVNYEGYNFHYFSNTAQAPLVYAGSNYKHFVSACSSRLILNDINGPDDRAQSSYIIDVGHDWKTESNGCTTNEYGSTLCYAMGAGKFIRVKTNWRRVVYSTMSSADLSTNPLPPSSLFSNPDGSFGDGTTNSSGTTTDSKSPNIPGSNSGVTTAKSNASTASSTSKSSAKAKPRLDQDKSTQETAADTGLTRIPVVDNEFAARNTGSARTALVVAGGAVGLILVCFVFWRGIIRHFTRTRKVN